MRSVTRGAALKSALVLLAGAVSCARAPRKRVAVIPKGTAHLFWRAVKAGAGRAGEDLGIEVLWNGPNQETEYARQIQIVDAMIAQRVDGIAIAACDRKALVKPVDRAVAAGIPVTVFDSGLDSDNYVSFVATDNVEGGRMAARELARLVGERGDVAVIEHVPGSVSTTDRESGFAEAMGKEFPGIRIVQKLYGMSDRAKALAAAENILTAHPALEGLFCSTEPSATGALVALKGRGLAGRVKVVGFDSSDGMIDDLKSGTLHATVVQDPFRIGYEAVRTIATKLAGGTPPRRLDLPARVIRREMLEQPEIQRLLRPDLDGEGR